MSNLSLAQSNGVNACYYLFLDVITACCCLSLLVVNSRQKQELQQGVNLELLSQFPTHFKQSTRNVNHHLVIISLTNKKLRFLCYFSQDDDSKISENDSALFLQIGEIEQ